MPDLTQAQLKAVLEYNPDTGLFRWRQSGKGRDMTKPAGTLNNFGYVTICIAYVRYVAHRLAWLYIYGEFPEYEIDHINRERSDNRLCNLRVATRSQNSTNSQTRSDNTSGHPGICWDRQKLKWKVQISVKDNRRLQKHFADFDAAVEFYRTTAQNLFGEFASADRTLNDL